MPVVSRVMRTAAPALARSAVLALALCRASVGNASLVLNEVFADPSGPDEGMEWVEIMNTGPSAVALPGVSLESGNGAGPGQWKRVWQGSSGEWIEPGGFFVVGGGFAGRAPDSPARCELQNGPDGVRLLREDLELDRVGWGEHTWAEYFEGRPIPVSPSGHSLARRADGVDSDDNLSDFESKLPSPGGANRPLVDLAVRLRRAGPSLPLLSGTGSARSVASVRNLGRRPAALDSITLVVGGQALLVRGALTEVRAGLGESNGIAPGESLEIAVRLPAAGGQPLLAWSAEVSYPADCEDRNDRDTLRARAGAPPLAFSEIAPRPTDGGTEWIELHLRTLDEGALAGWSVRDAGGAELHLGPLAGIQQGEYVVVARDTLALTLPPHTGHFIRWSGAWPSLNDLARDDGVADTLRLLDASGFVADWAVWGEAERGAVWIRVPGAGDCDGLSSWASRPAAESSPGEAGAGSAAAPIGTGMHLVPDGVSFERHPDGIWFHLPDALVDAAWCLRVVDLEGRELWRRTGGAGENQGRYVRWDGRSSNGPVRRGLLWVELRVQDESGTVHSQRQGLAIGSSH